MLKAEGVEINEQAIQDQMRVLIRSKEEDSYRAREHDKNAPGFFSFDTVKNIGSTVGTIFSGTLRGESFGNKIAMRALYSDELNKIEEQYAGDATAEAKAIDDFISNSYIGTIKNIGAEIMLPNAVKAKDAFESLTGKEVNELALDIADKTDDYVEKLNSEVFQYEMGVTEMFSDAIEQGDFSGYIRALTATTKKAVESAPYMAVAAVPGGLGIIGVSTAAGGEFKENSEASKAYDELIILKITDPNYDTKKKELEETIRNGGISFQNLAHHSVVGLSNSIFERWSGGLAKSFFNTFRNQPKDIVEKNLKQYVLGFVKDSGGEGLTEGTQTAIEKASNFLIQGKEVDFQEAMQEIYDAIIIGTVSAVGPSGGSNSINILRTGINNKKQKTLINEAGVNNAVELFEGDVNRQELDFTQINGTDVKINAELDLQVSKGEKTIEEANTIKERYRDVQGAVNQIKPLGLSETVQPNIVNLILEKNKLIKKIKDTDSALTKEESTRVNEINKELNDLVVKDKAKVIVKDIETLGETFEGFKNITSKTDLKGSSEIESFLQTKIQEGNLRKDFNIEEALLQPAFVIQDPNTGQQEIILNPDVASSSINMSDDFHEAGHAIMFETIRKNPEVAKAIAENLKVEINKIDTKLLEEGEFKERLDQYKQDVADGKLDPAGLADETIQIFSQAVYDGTIKPNSSLVTKLMDFVRQVLQDFGIKDIKFNKSQDVINFVKDYSQRFKDIKAGKVKGLGKGITKAATKGITGKIITEGKTADATNVIEDVIVRFTQTDKGKQASNKVQEIYDAKGKDGAFEIIEQFAPIVSRIVEKRSEAPNFDRQLLTDEINTGKRGIIDLIAEYKPDSNVPLAAYINKYLPARSIEASRRVLGQEFTTDVTEAKGVITTETEIETETLKPKAKKSPKGDAVYSSVLAENLGSDVATAVDAAIEADLLDMNVGDRFGNTKNIGPKLGEVLGKMFGLDSRVFTDKSWNIKQGDLAGLTNLKQYLNSNAINDFKLLPDAYNSKGKSNFIPDNILNKLYTKDGKNKWKKDPSKTIADYKALLGEMIKPVYRASEATTVKGLAGLSFRNKIFETAVPDALDRVDTGVKFSKGTIKTNLDGKAGIDDITNQSMPNGNFKGNDKTIYMKESVENFENVTGIPVSIGLRTSNQLSLGSKVQGSATRTGQTAITRIKNTRGLDKNKAAAITKANQKAVDEGRFYEFVTAKKKAIDNSKGKDLINVVTNKPFTKQELIDLENIFAAKTDATTDFNIKNLDSIKRGQDLLLKILAIKAKEKNGINTQFISEFLYNSMLNDNTGRNNAPTLGNIEGYKEGKKTEEHTFQANNWARRTMQAITDPNPKNLEGWINYSGDQYYQLTIPKDADGRLNKRYNINGKLYSSSSKEFPLLKEALDLAFETADWSNVLDSAIRMFHPFTYKEGGLEKTVNINPNITTLNGKTYAEIYNVVVPASLKNDPDTVKIQAAIIYDVIRGETTLAEAKNRINVYVNSLAKPKAKQSKALTKQYAPKLLDNITTEQKIETLNNYDKTLKFSRSLNTKPKGISVFDFDDTLAKTKEKVIVNKADGTTIEISAAKFAEQATELQEAGATFNFDNFENVGKGTQKGPLADLALKRQGKFGSKDIFVLTARPQIAATDIKMFLDGIGLNLPIENITGLEDGSPQAKATWVISKTAEGYNDFYFADDAIKNVKAVAEILDQVDVKSKVQIAKFSKVDTFDKVINNILEDSAGIKSEAEFSRARAQTVGAKKGKFTFFTTPSAEDFVGLIYKFLGKGKVGDAQFKFFQDNLIDPYNRAEQAVTRAKITAANDFKALKNSLKTLPRSLSKQTGIGGFTFGQAARVAVWTRQGMEVPGLSKRDAKELNDFIDNNAELDVFVDELINIQKGKPYPKPNQTWLAGNITSDIVNEINKVNRKEYMQEFNENVDIIFSDKIMNKLEAAYGPRYVEALRDTLRRMKSGSNRPIGNSRIVDGLLNWLNNSVGAIMFLNTRSAVLQTISAVNFINFGNNNLIAAGKAFANQKQYWKDFMTLFNSPYLVERRDGLKINVSESEIADAVAESSNKPKAFLNLLLNKGFILTRIADSFAIAAGGSTFYRNQVKAYVKSGMDQVAAEKQAFDDFYSIAETNQQSSNPSKISQQQASGAGRVILAFANTPMQYARIIKRSSQDLINGRGDWKTNVSKIVYYGAMQNLIFNALQTALFALAFGEEDEEQEDKTGRIANGMADSLLKRFRNTRSCCCCS